jgi:regulator of sirC expression with transglutaminase-like and TPR domain
LNTPAKVLEYLREVEDLRTRAFLAFKDDADLSKEIMTPAGEKEILPFLLDTLKRARHHQQRALKVFAALTDH